MWLKNVLPSCQANSYVHFNSESNLIFTDQVNYSKKQSVITYKYIVNIKGL